MLALFVLAMPVGRAQAPVTGEERATSKPAVVRTTRARVAVARSIRVAADEEVQETVTVIGGSLRVEGRVLDGVVVVGGNLELGATADVAGEIVVVGGRLDRTAGSRVRGPITHVALGDWRRWSVGGVSVPALRAPSLESWAALLGSAGRLTLLACLLAVVVVLARAPVARVGRAAAATPVRAFLLGLVAEVLFVPSLLIVTLGLIITLVGIPVAALVVPVTVLLLLLGFVMGFAGITIRLGEWAEDRLGWRINSAVIAMLCGLALVLSPTLLSSALAAGPELRPALFSVLLVVGIAVEFVVWTTGLGATLLTGFGRWFTAPPPLPRAT